MPYGYIDPDTLASIVEKYALNNNTFGLLAIQNYIFGIDCREADNYYLP